MEGSILFYAPGSRHASLEFSESNPANT